MSRMLGWMIAVLGMSSCGGATSAFLALENDTGKQMWFFSYSPCGEEDWTETLAVDEYIADGSVFTTYGLTPDCYDLYAEDESGCFAVTSSDATVVAGSTLTWTLVASDMNCP